MTQVCTPRVCSSALAPGFNLGSKETPKWIYIGSDGAPYFGDQPETFKAKEILRKGLPMLNTDGIYTKSQRENMIELTQKGDATTQVIAHLTQTVHENQGTLWTQLTQYDTLLDPAITRAIQAGVTPFPYGLMGFIPIWIRIVFLVLLLLLLTKCFGEPLVLLCRSVKDAGVGVLETLAALITPRSQLLKLQKDTKRLTTHLINGDEVEMTRLNDIRKEMEANRVRDLAMRSEMDAFNNRLIRVEQKEGLPLIKRPSSRKK